MLQVLLSVEATNGAGLGVVKQLEKTVILDTSPPSLDYIQLQSEYTKVTHAVHDTVTHVTPCLAIE